MRVAALYDIHGNLPALEAVVGDLAAASPDLVVVGGDAVPGPMPGEVLERLAAMPWPMVAIRGNGEREVLEGGDEEARWVAGRLSEGQRAGLEGLPLTHEVRVGGRRVLFFHATPGSDTQLFTPRTREDRLRHLLGSPDADVLVCGHIHVQFERRLDDRLILNAGSVGVPYERDPGAYWLLLDGDRHEFRRTTYDTEAAARQFDATGHPGGWVAEALREPATPEAAIEEFDRRA